MDALLEEALRLQPGSNKFDILASELWKYQVRECAPVRLFLEKLESDQDDQVFIPIEFFKKFEMKTGKWEHELCFESSGTTGITPSRHFIRTADTYRDSLKKGYEFFYGNKKKLILALLPSYLERGNSSLVFMVDEWIKSFGLPGSDFFLYDFETLISRIKEGIAAGEEILLIGVTYALLDFASEHAFSLPASTIVMETGGMKGRRKEMTKEEVHAILRTAFGVSQIHSEYGMTELLSQAYAKSEGLFECPPWMRVVITDPYLYDRELPAGSAGRINIIDLMNVHSCAFIQTEDMGRIHPDGRFEVLGRMDHASLRGCNLMYEG